MKRISFDKYDAEHIYEWLRLYWANQEDDGYKPCTEKRFGGCFQCQRIGKRLEKLLGDKTIIRYYDRLVKKEEDKHKQELFNYCFELDDIDWKYIENMRKKLKNKK